MGLVAPAGTPAPIVERLNAAINEGLKSPEARATFTRIGFQTQPGSTQEFVARIAGDSDKWAAVIKLTGAKVD
jgi:tripartite-type tricarboxylate transporter receptor subunit TctC